MVAKAHTFTLEGPNARHVVVELDVRSGLPAFAIVGLADAAVREARERIQTAIRNSGFEWPRRRITANLAPGDLRKAGPGLDLALACAILAATGQVPAERLAQIGMFGELGLDGGVRPAQGTLAVADEARRRGLRALALAAPAGHAAALVRGLEVAPLCTLQSAARLLRGGPADPLPPRFEHGAGAPERDEPELSEVRGAAAGVRALLIAAAGGHSILLTGPPGAGKTMLARRLPGILPALGAEEAVEVARLHGSADLSAQTLDRRPPFRAPHHATTAAGLLGGAGNGWVGELALAHRGVLFLDEVSEFSRSALEALRQPLEEGRVSVARARRSRALPARFLLVCATNPCRCGRLPCRCSPQDLQRHARALSEPLLDRIDLRVSLEPARRALALEPAAPTSERARALVAEAREIAAARGTLNAGFGPRELARHAGLDSRCERVLREAGRRGELSARGQHRTIRVARTIADLDGRARVRESDLLEALALRRAAPRHGSPD
jgi:magnesium chelatase family protein